MAFILHLSFSCDIIENCFQRLMYEGKRETTPCESQFCTHCFEFNDCHNLRLPNVQPLQKIIEWVNICHLKIYFKQKIIHSMSLTVRKLFNLNGFFRNHYFSFLQLQCLSILCQDTSAGFISIIYGSCILLQIVTLEQNVDFFIIFMFCTT